MILGSRYDVTPAGKRTIFKFKCDHCQTIFERPEKKSRRARPTHYCNLLCTNAAQKSGGSLDIVRVHEFTERLGVAYPMQSAEIRAKTVATCRERYGVDNVQQVPEIKHKSCVTFLKNLEDGQKYHGVWTSKSEDAFFAKLIEHFDPTDVVRQKRVTEFSSMGAIDFYIKSIDTYIQFDGAYWHGLNRDIEEIKKSLTSRDIGIVAHWKSDRAQDAAFQARGLRLIRVSDVEFFDVNITQIIDRIRAI